MKRLSILAACLTLAACGGGFDFRDGFPTAENVRLEMPGSSQALSGVQQQELQGDHSSFYDLTRGVTLGVNTGVGLVLGLVKAITDHQPTTVNGNTAVWGPHSEPLSPNTWQFTVTEVSPGSYEYKLEGRAKAAPNSAFVTVLSGEHTPAVSATGSPMKHFGAGSFVLDWDAAQTLPEHGPEVGKAEVTYARPNPGANTTIDVSFVDVKDGATGALIDAEYRYVRKPQQGGEFEFSTDKDIHNDPALALSEHLTIKSRWMQTGEGRSDVKATGGDLASAATANECWDSNFDSQYLAASWAPADPNLNYGTEAIDCAFTTAEYSSL